MKRIVPPRTKAVNQNPIGLTLYGKGVNLVSGTQPGNPSGTGGGIRGKVSGWSRASRRRLREFLLKHELRIDYKRFGVTLTIPGPSLPHLQSKLIWRNFAITAKDHNWAIVWRAEVQERGQMHFHLLAGLPIEPNWSYSVYEFGQAWFKAIDHFYPHVVYDKPRKEQVGEYEWVSYDEGPLSGWPGANKHAIDIEEDEGGAAWYRYISDHASKVKQGQVGVNIGRHWGVVGRHHFIVMPGNFERLSDIEMDIAMRMLRHLKRGSVKKDCVFGRKKRKGSLWGKRGSQPVFVNPDTVNRMIECARKIAQERQK